LLCQIELEARRSVAIVALLGPQAPASVRHAVHVRSPVRDPIAVRSSVSAGTIADIVPSPGVEPETPVEVQRDLRCREVEVETAGFERLLGEQDEEPETDLGLVVAGEPPLEPELDERDGVRPPERRDEQPVPGGGPALVAAQAPSVGARDLPSAGETRNVFVTPSPSSVATPGPASPRAARPETRSTDHVSSPVVQICGCPDAPSAARRLSIVPDPRCMPRRPWISNASFRNTSSTSICPSGIGSPPPQAIPPAKSDDDPSSHVIVPSSPTPRRRTRSSRTDVLNTIFPPADVSPAYARIRREVAPAAGTAARMATAAVSATRTTTLLLNVTSGA
jgi:hypothetical protein